MRPDILQLAAELAGRDAAFALATVVRREPPSSARVGDAAIVTPEGEFHGWLGGSCTRPTVIREALAALADDAPRLIGIVRDPQSATQSRSGLTVFPMACHSGGSVEIYIEPMLPARRLLIFGVAPAALALARLAAVLGYRVEAVDPEANEALFPDASRLVNDDESIEPPGSARDAARCFAVVATLGQRDEEAIWAAIRLKPAYVGVVASRKRFGRMREALAARGANPEALDRIAVPAGLDIGAETPEEIALSVLAEITARKRPGAGTTRPEHGRRPEPASAPAESGSSIEPDPATAATAEADSRVEPNLATAATAAVAATARDPVCGMTVAAAAASHPAEVGGETYYFCCAHCRTQFLAEPHQFGAAAAETGT